MAAHQAPPSLGFSRQEHWSGLPFPSPMHESEKWKWRRSVLSRIRLLATPWTAAYQAPLSMGFSRQECWSGVPLPSLLPFILRFPFCLSPLHDLSYQYSDSPGSGSSSNPSWTFSPSFSQLQETTSEPALSSLPLTLTSCKKHPAFLWHLVSLITLPYLIFFLPEKRIREIQGLKKIPIKPENGCQNQWTLHSQNNLYLQETSLPSFSDLQNPTLEVSCPLAYGRIMILYILLDDSIFILRLGAISGTGSVTKVIFCQFQR